MARPDSNHSLKNLQLFWSTRLGQLWSLFHIGFPLMSTMVMSNVGRPKHNHIYITVLVVQTHLEDITLSVSVRNWHVVMIPKCHQIIWGTGMWYVVLLLLTQICHDLIWINVTVMEMEWWLLKYHIPREFLCGCVWADSIKIESFFIDFYL